MNEVAENIIENIVTETELLSNIHTDLSAIACFLVFFSLVIILYFGYRFFDMMWKF